MLVVGRNDTGELEAQVRGSRHAWHVRLISVDALVSLVKVKETTEATATGAKIRGVLVPMEYTKLDGLIDVIFSAAKDIETGGGINANLVKRARKLLAGNSPTQKHLTRKEKR